MSSKKISVRDLCIIGVFAAIISVLSPISIPMPYGVPFTLQTFIIPFAGIILGAKRGTMAAIVYVLLGALGMPVFNSYQAGLGMVIGPTGGFIFSFPLMALAAGIGADKGKKGWLVAGLAAGAVINYLCGMLMFSFVTESSLYKSFAVCVLPFIPLGIVKAVLAGVVGVRCRGLLAKGGLLNERKECP